MSFSIDAPVVVKPDMLSNRALITLNSPPYIMKGIAPNSQAVIHALKTMVYPSLAWILSTVLVIRTGNSPHIRANNPATANGTKLLSDGDRSAVMADNINSSDIMSRTIPQCLITT